ncbi:MAG: phosphoglycerate dehydrogenase [Planctomycetota bacterium]|jgi:phosphoglycerate dehydrogenase-like enzyme
MAKKILVTPRSLTRDGHPALDRLKEAGFEVVFCTRGKQPDENELLSLVPGCVGWLAGVERISARVFEAAKELKVIGRNGVGVDKIDLAAAETAGVSICKAVGANSRGVAELAFASILSLVRAIPFSDARLKAGEWERRKGVELDGRTLGLVLAFGMKVLAHDPYPDESFAPAAGLSYVDLDRVLAGSDVVSLHCPPREDGRPLIDKTALAKMKEGVYVVNTARAELLDEEAVLEALRSGRIAALATDVYRQEPPTGSPLVESDRVIATPHIGGYTRESVTRAVGAAVDAILSELAK